MDNTLSILPSDGASSEFPVLKAFQQYIDAEQAKARKRMLGLSVFFIILLVVVVVTFVLVLTTVVNRNQALSDRLLDYALKEREKAPQNVQQTLQPAVQQSPQPSIHEYLKPFIERLEREQEAMKAIYEKQQKEAEEKFEKKQKEAEEKYERQRKEAEEKYERLRKEDETKAAARELARDEEIRKAKIELEKERARVKKENDRQAEIERQRRRLYPEYYRTHPESADDYAVPPPTVKQAAQSTSLPAKQVPAATPAPAATQTPSAAPPSAEVKPAGKKTASPLSTIKPVTYFNLDEDSVPFLLETPKQTTK